MNNKKLITNRLLAVCIAALIGCWILKLCGGEVFEFVVKNEFFIKVCHNIENSIIKYIIYWMFYVFNGIIMLLIITKEKRFSFKRTLIYIGLYTFTFCINFYSNLIKTIVDLALTIMIPIICHKRKWYESLLFVVGLLVLQFGLLQIRNIGYTLYFENFIVGLLYQLDYYIMLIIFYIRRTL